MKFNVEMAFRFEGKEYGSGIVDNIDPWAARHAHIQGYGRYIQDISNVVVKDESAMTRIKPVEKKVIEQPVKEEPKEIIKPVEKVEKPVLKKRGRKKAIK